MVSGRERVEAALALDVADRPPVSAWGHAYDREWSAEQLAHATVELARRHRLDFVKLQVRASCFAEAFGAEWRYSGSPGAEPKLVRPGGVDAAAWHRIVEAAPDMSPLREQVEALRRVAGALGDGVPVIQTVFSPGMVAWFLAGRDTHRLLALTAEDPALVRAGLEAIARPLTEFTHESLAAGAAGIFYAINPLADTTLLPPDRYRDVFAAADRLAVAAAAEGWFNMLHLCGGHIDLGLAEELRMHCLNWSVEDAGNPGLAETRDRLGVAVAGGVNRYAPIRASREEIRRAAEAAVAETGRRGLLLTPGCSASPWSQVRDENLAQLFAAAA